MTNRDPDAQRAAGMLAPDLLPWERQPDETEGAYQAFREFLNSDHRRVTDHGPSAKNWSMRYLWSTRAHEYDVYMARVDLEEQVRYRRKMNERHRRVAAVAQSKVVAWLERMDADKIAKMSAADATRLLDVAVRIERMATSVVSAEDLPDPYGEPPRKNGLEQRLLEANLDVELGDIARLIHEKLGQPASEPPRQAQAEDGPAPLGPQPGQETPPESVWGER